MSDDIHKARKMTFRLYALGERSGSPFAGEIAQMLAINAYSQNDKALNVIKLSLETAEIKSSTAPLNKATKLFMDARQDISRPFSSRSECLQSCIYDVLLCYTSFWGQVFEYYETMYYKPVELGDGSLDSSPANVSLEAGWMITCLFIRDMMLSSAARAAGVASGYDRSMSWFFYPANATSELEEAKALVLTVIGKIRKRGTVLVSSEGMIGHISFSNSVPLTHWVEDNLDKDWNNVEKLAALSVEYFESTSIRVNVNVTPVSSESGSADAANLSFGPDTSFLEGLDNMDSSDNSPTPSGLLSISNRSISLNVRPVTPILFGSPLCEWSGVDMGDFCREISAKCQWPEVANTVSTAGQIGISVLNMGGEVVVSQLLGEKRKSFSAPSRLSFTPDAREGAILPFSTPVGMPNLEPLVTSVPQFGIPIPELTPTPTRGSISLPKLTPTPPIARRARDSEVTFFGDKLSPLDSVGPQALVALPSDADFDFSDRPSDASPPKKRNSGLSRPSTIISSPVQHKPVLPALVEAIVAAAKRDLSSKDWSIEAALGALAKGGKSIESLYGLVNQAVLSDQNEQDSGAKKRRRRSSEKGRVFVPILDMQILKLADQRLKLILDVVERRSLKNLNQAQRSTLETLSRLLALVSLCMNPREVSDTCLKSAVAVAGDLVAFCHGIAAVIPGTDVYAAGLRGAYVEADIAMIEAGKDIGLCDWYGLSLFLNDTAFQVLLSEKGLFTPNAVSSAPPAPRYKGPQKLIGSHMSVWERIPQHCLFICSELMMRWAWAPSSRLWTVVGDLTADFFARRHESELYEVRTSEIEIDQLNYFIKESLLSAGLYLCDLADRLDASDQMIHAAFDIVRATVLLRPELLKGRHLLHIVFCAVAAASAIFAHTERKKPIDFASITQAAALREPNPDAQSIIKKYVCKSVCLSSAGGAILFSDCSGALVLPNASGECQPEFQLTGDVRDFYESVFVSEMRQVLYNIRKVTLRRETPQADMGPFPQNFRMDRSLSPFAFISLSSALALAMQQTLGQSGMQSKTVKYHHFPRALAIVSPLGVLPCLLPPVEPAAEVPLSKGDKVFRWINESAIKATNNGSYSVIHQTQHAFAA